MVRTHSATHTGPEGAGVEIEASLQSALPAIVITGLPGEVVKESRERIRACLSGLGYDIPSERVVVHLSPATEKKQGSQLDLGIAAAILCAERQIRLPRKIETYGFLGELCIDGRIRGVKGALALAQALIRVEQVKFLFVPMDNMEEVGLLHSEKVHPVSHLTEVIRALQSETFVPQAPKTLFDPISSPGDCLLDRIQGQRLGKRALQIALAGRHHLLLVGPPGVGKSLLATAASGLLPPLQRAEWIELIKSRSYYDPQERLTGQRPFRSPHHSVSAAALLGGGTGTITAGEVTFSHGGILFLDELPEFRKDALEGLREPLQSGEIHLHRIGCHFTLPARFLLIAAMNPCPCGFSLDPRRSCRCPSERAAAYRRKISGPIYDRMDLCAVLGSSVTANEPSDPSHREVFESIQTVHQIQSKRFMGQPWRHNADAEVDCTQGPFALDSTSQAWLNSLCQRECLSFRSLHKTVRVARTIADLEGADEIGAENLCEAWGLRCRDFSNLHTI